jgi:hypothetical protein
MPEVASPVPTPRPLRVLVARVRRQAVILLEVADFCVSDAVAAVLEAAADAEAEGTDVRT